MAIVVLDEGLMVTSHLTDLGGEPVQIRMPVEMVSRKIKEDVESKGRFVV